MYEVVFIWKCACALQLRRAEDERLDVVSALTSRDEQLRQKDRELADKTAELTALRASMRQQAQPAQQPQQAQQQQHRLQRVGSVASTTHRCAAADCAWYQRDVTAMRAFAQCNHGMNELLEHSLIHCQALQITVQTHAVCKESVLPFAVLDLLLSIPLVAIVCTSLTDTS